MNHSANAPATPTLRVEGLSKHHDIRPIFRNLAFSWSGPGVICVCGPNGSGKTTLLSMLGGAAAPDSGDIRIRGSSLVSAREETLPQLYFLPDGCPVYPFVTGQEWLDFVRSVRRPVSWSADALVQAFGLTPYLSTGFGAMSLGTARKFLLTAALACPSQVMVLDEPTNGLDASSLAVLREQLSHRADKSLVVMCCHDTEQQRLMNAHCVDLAGLEAA